MDRDVFSLILRGKSYYKVTKLENLQVKYNISYCSFQAVNAWKKVIFEEIYAEFGSEQCVTHHLFVSHCNWCLIQITTHDINNKLVINHINEYFRIETVVEIKVAGSVLSMWGGDMLMTGEA